MKTKNITATATATASKPAKPATQAKPAEQAKEGAGGKGNQLPAPSKAQLQARFEQDSSALASALIALGAVEVVQRHHKTGNITARRVHATLEHLAINRNKLAGEQRKMASAALEAAFAVAIVQDGARFVSLELTRNSTAIRAKREAGKYHKGNK
jgi:hypothetical protein